MGESLLVAGNAFAWNLWAPSGLGPFDPVLTGAPLANPSRPLPGPRPEWSYDCPLPVGIRPFSIELATSLLPLELETELRTVENRFRHEPTEANILAFLAVLSRHELHVNDLRERMTINCERMYGNNQPFDFAAGPGDGAAQAFFGSLSEFRRGSERQFAGFENSYLGPMEETLRARLLAMVRGSGDDARRAINESFVHQLLGEQVLPVTHLLLALESLDRREGASGAAPDLLLDRVTVRHRLVSLNQTTAPTDSDALDRAETDIQSLERTHPDYAVLLRSENLKLRRTLEERHFQADVRAERIEAEHASEVREERVGSVLERTIRNAEEGLSRVQDPAVRDLLRRDLADAAAALVEQRYSAAVLQYVTDRSDDSEREPTEANLKADAADATVSCFERLRGTLGPELFSEMQARMLLARAYHAFRRGTMEDAPERTGALTDLETILRDHPESGAARFIRTQGNWPHQYGIVRDDGSLSPDLHTEDFGAALLSLAGMLTEDEGRALAGCGTGAVLVAGATLIFGKNVSAGSLILGCAAGTLVERTDYILGHLDRLEQAYRSGVSNVTVDEALRSLGEFALTTFSIFAGHRLGLLVSRGIGVGGRFVGGELASLFTRSGFTPGPWTRGLATLALTETGHAAQAVTLHGAVVASQRIAHPDAEIPFTFEGAFGTWIFSRFLGPLVRMNPAQTFLPTPVAGGTTGYVFNHVFAVATLEAGREIVLGEDLSRYGDRVAQGLLYMAPFLPMMSRTQGSPPTSGGIPPAGSGRGGAPGNSGTNAAALLNYAALKPGAIVRVPIADIVPTQGKVFAGKVDVYVRKPGGEVPEIRVLDGRPYVVDGHHRIFAARARGETTIEVRNYDSATDPNVGLMPLLRERATRWDQVVLQVPAPQPGSRTTYPWLN